MTTHEALITGMIWGALARSGRGDNLAFELECPSYGTEDAPRGEIVVRWANGVELLVTITETRSA